MIEMFLGHTAGYWLELDLRMKQEFSFEAPRLLEEIVAMKGKISFYESRIKEMAQMVPK